MDHLLEYIRWRGDRRFEEEPFGLNDALVLCELSYLEKAPLPGKGEKKTFRGLYEAYEAAGVHMTSAFGTVEEIETVMKAAAESVRFGELELSDCVEYHDPARSVQFAAFLFHPDKNTRYIAFRGTDDTLDGWKEDFMLSFTETEAQKMARRYLEENTPPGSRCYVGGHSKGGNLALYAACLCGEETFGRILQVHVLDGPGLCPEVLSPDLIRRIDPVTVRLLPEYCVVGRLFDVPLSNTVLVRSDETGIMQHCLTSWGVDPSGPIPASEADPESEELSGILRMWLDGEGMEARQKLTQELFDILGRTGETSLSGAMKKMSLEAALTELMKISPDTKKAGMRLGIRMIFEDEVDRFHAQGLVDYLSGSRTVRYLALLLIGFAMAVFSRDGLLRLMAGIMAGASAVEVALTLRRLSKAGWAVSRYRARVTLCGIMMLFTGVLLFKEGAMEVFGSILLGAVMIYGGSLLLTAARNETRWGALKVLDWICSVCICLAGFGLLFVPIGTEGGFIGALGGLICLYALGHFLAVWIMRAVEKLPRSRRPESDTGR